MSGYGYTLTIYGSMTITTELVVSLKLFIAAQGKCHGYHGDFLSIKCSNAKESKGGVCNKDNAALSLTLKL